MADDKGQDKGQNFLTKSFLKNEAFASKGQDVAALNKTMSFFASSNIKAIFSLSKQLGLLNQNIFKLAKPVQQKKDLVRREDSTMKLYKSVDDLENLMRENNKIQKDNQKKKGFGLLDLLGLVGKAFAIGGILGFLFTGKKEFLFTAIKGVTKYMFGLPIMIAEYIGKKLFLAMGSKVTGLFGKIFGGIGNTLMKIPGVAKFGGMIGKIFKPITSIFSGIGKVFAPLGKLFGGAIGKVAGKVGGGLAKKVFMKIPVIGSLLGLFFGIQRFKKGDIVGGLLEIVSGSSSLLNLVAPGAGLAVGLAIDAFLAFRDVKNAMTPAKEQPAPKPPTDLRKIPVIGSVIGMFDAIAKFVKDPIGAITDVAGVMENIIPGSGQMVLNAIGWVKGLMDLVPEPIKNGFNAVKGGIKNVAKSIINAPKKLIEKVGEKALGASESFLASSQNFLGESADRDVPLNGTEQKTGERGNGWWTFDPWKPNIKNVNPLMWSNFQNMSSDYFNKTGKSIQINSGFRNENGSIHKVGQALDIQPENANELEKLGLMEKYGFHRPLINWKVKKEPWHLEPYPGKEYGPRNSLNYPVRHAASSGVKPLIGGDNLNLPQTKIAGKVSGQDNQKIDLSDATIKSLANAMGVSFKGAIPTPKANSVSIDTGMRG